MTFLLGGHRGFGCTDHTHYQTLRDIATLPAENTLESVERAFRNGADFVEIDAVPTADGDIVVLHNVVPADHFFGTQPTATINMQTLAQVQAHPTGRMQNGKVAKLSDMLALITRIAPVASPYMVNIELKGSQRAQQPWDGFDFINNVAEVMRASPLSQGQILFSSFALRNVIAMAQVLPNAQYGMLFYEKPMPEDIYTSEPNRWDLQALPFNEDTVDKVAAHFTAHAPTSTKLQYLHPELGTVENDLMVKLGKQGWAFNFWSLMDRPEPARFNRYGVIRDLAAQHGFMAAAITDYLPELKKALG